MRSRRVTTLLAALIVTVGFWPGAASASNDESFTKKWALPQIGAPDAWAKTTGAGVRIGIVDTDVELSHQDLARPVHESTVCAGSHRAPNVCVSSADGD